MVTENTTTTQPNSQAMSPEDAKASMGIATRLGDELLRFQGFQNPQMQEEGQETQDSAPGQEQPQQTDKPAPQEEQAPQMANFEAILSEKLDAMRQELKADHQREIDQLKEQIQQALTEDNAESQ